MRLISTLSLPVSLLQKLRCTVLVVLVCSFASVALAQQPQPALPRVYVDTTWSLPTGGTTWAAHTAAQFTSALNTSLPGDIIVLDAGVIYQGNFTVPAKSNPTGKWIYVTSSAYNKLPPPNTRVTPSYAVNMPKIVTPGATPALQFKDGANHWRFVGIEIYSASTYRPTGYTPGIYYGYALVQNSSNPSVTLPDSITFDRSYIHGDSTHDVQMGIQGNGRNYAVIDSYISDIHMKGTDTQAFVAYWTPGPIKLVNNHLEAAGENIMFGGAGGTSNPYVASDIEIRNNYLFKPLSWVPLTSSPINQWVEKDAFELKSAQRVLFDSNTIENVWMAGQMGFAIVLTVRSGQSGDITVINDITITNNVLKNVVSGFNSLVADDTCANGSSYPNCRDAGSADRWYIGNNLMTFYDPTILGGARNEMMSLTGGTDRPNGGIYIPMKNLVFQHNTGISAASKPCWMSLYFTVPGTIRPPISHLTNNIWILDNVLCTQPTGDWGLQGTTGLTQYMGDPTAAPYDLTQRFFGNVMYVPSGNKVQNFPPHNYATPVNLTYVNPSIGNYQLLTPYWTDTSDGQIAGVDFTKLPSTTLPGGVLPWSPLQSRASAAFSRY